MNRQKPSREQQKVWQKPYTWTSMLCTLFSERKYDKLKDLSTKALKKKFRMYSVLLFNSNTKCFFFLIMVVLLCQQATNWRSSVHSYLIYNILISKGVVAHFWQNLYSKGQYHRIINTIILKGKKRLLWRTLTLQSIFPSLNCIPCNIPILDSFSIYSRTNGIPGQW